MGILRARDLVRRDPPPASPAPFITVLAAGAGLRLLAMLGYPGALWFSDSFVYLGAALRPQPGLTRTTGYSLFLRALEPLHSLTLVTGVQIYDVPDAPGDDTAGLSNWPKMASPHRKTPARKPGRRWFSAFYYILPICPSWRDPDVLE